LFTGYTPVGSFRYLSGYGGVYTGSDGNKAYSFIHYIDEETLVDNQTFVYRITENNEAVLLSVSPSYQGVTLEVPSMIDGYDVINIEGSILSGNHTVKTVTFDPNSIITTIESFVFAYTQVETIILPKSVKRIEASAFAHSEFLRYVYFDEEASGVYFESGSFQYHLRLSVIEIPEGSRVESYLFGESPSWSESNFGSFVQTILVHPSVTLDLFTGYTPVGSFRYLSGYGGVYTGSDGNKAYSFIHYID
jgi:hypothetical protein